MNLFSLPASTTSIVNAYRTGQGSMVNAPNAVLPSNKCKRYKPDSSKILSINYKECRLYRNRQSGGHKYRKDIHLRVRRGTMGIYFTIILMQNTKGEE